MIAAEDFREDPSAALDEIVEFIGGAPFYFSHDLDVLDPTEFAPVSAPVAEGLSLADVCRVSQALLERDPVAADVVEYNAMLDPDARSCQVLAPLMEMYRSWLQPPRDIAP